MKLTLILGCGYLGLAVARCLREASPEAQVIGTSRSEARFGEIAAVGARPLVVDALDPESLNRLPDADAIVHCAAYGRGSPARPALAMGNILAELDRRGWRGRLVHISTTSVYGQLDGSWVDEDSEADPTSEAGRAALAAEVLLRAARPTAVIIRAAGLYGPGRVIGRAGLERGEPVPGHPDRWLNLIRIEDGARVVIAALGSDAPAPLYVAGDDRPVTRGEYYATLARRLGVPSPEFLGGSDGEPNRRIRNWRMREGLGVVPHYPDIGRGLADIAT